MAFVTQSYVEVLWSNTLINFPHIKLIYSASGISAEPFCTIQMVHSMSYLIASCFVSKSKAKAEIELISRRILEVCHRYTLCLSMVCFNKLGQYIIVRTIYSLAPISSEIMVGEACIISATNFIRFAHHSTIQSFI